MSRKLVPTEVPGSTGHLLQIPHLQVVLSGKRFTLLAIPRSLRIRTLDGWRGVAILMVIAEHALRPTIFRFGVWANLGALGVDIFFLVSGYIITLRLLKERERTDRIHLGHFYLRRAFRILPLVCTYLLTLCVLSIFVNLRDFHFSEVVGSLLFFRNYQFAANPAGIFTTHFWSLSIEEHFYLLWPALFLFLGNRAALRLALAGACLCGIWREFDSTYPTSWIGRLLPGSETWIRQVRTDDRFDGLLLGCALAILLTDPRVSGFIHRNFPKETPLFAAILLLLNVQRTNGLSSFSSFVLIAIGLASTLVVQEGLAHKWLNTRLLVWIGTISYSAYVWQQLFLTHPPQAPSPLGRMGSVPLNLLCVLAVSAASFYLIERPAIDLGRRLLARRKERLTASSAV
jgi:peptidoglycan/LPS O-acetylase OafA/YrhL